MIFFNRPRTVLGLVADQDFKCGVMSCWGIGDNDAVFREVQATLNRYAQALAFTPLMVDGKLGKKAVKAAVRVARHLQGKGVVTPAVVAVAAEGIDRKGLAEVAGMFLEDMKRDLGLLPALPTGRPGPTLPDAPVPNDAKGEPVRSATWFPQGFFTADKKIVYAIAGVALSLVVGYRIHRRK